MEPYYRDTYMWEVGTVPVFVALNASPENRPPIWVQLLRLLHLIATLIHSLSTQSKYSLTLAARK